MNTHLPQPDAGNRKSSESSIQVQDRTSIRKKSQGSCSLCRRRKIKCDRAEPCSNCVRAGSTCIPTTLSHGPRGRQGGRRKNDSELLQRIAKLEHLVKNIEGGATQTPSKRTPEEDGTQRESSQDKGIQHPPRSQSVITSRGTVKDGLNDYIGTSLWVTLGDEINGLRDVLNESSDDEELERKQSSRSDSISPTLIDQSSFIFRTPDSYFPESNAIPSPSRSQVRQLCSVYLSNIDPIIKVLHRPSLMKYLNGDTADMACSPGARGLHALRYAIFYAAITSMTPSECQQHLGQEQHVLLPRYQAEIEKGLARADFINTEDMSTLQALVIYLFAVRTHTSSRFSWTLASLAVRIGHAIGLHREGNVPSYPPFLMEMRRRLWWQIVQLDAQAASDRGSDPLVSEHSFNTKFPLHADDADWDANDVGEPRAREFFTDTTFALVCHEVYDVMRNLNYVPAGDAKGVESSDSNDPWAKRRDLVIKCQKHIEERYLRHCSMAVTFQRYTRLVADIITAVMWLMTYRPLQRQAQTTVSIPVPYPGLLHLAAEVVEKAHRIYNDPALAPYRWQSSAWVMWHAMAVMLAELCIQTEGATVERAWDIVDVVFDEMARNIADTENGRLWRPIKKLKNRASEVRRKSQSALLTTTIAPAIVPRTMAESSLPTINGLLDTTDPQHILTAQEPLILDPAGLKYDASNIVESVEGWNLDGLTTNPVPIDWDPWLNTNDVAGLPSYDNAIDQMAWTNWSNFISDFQGNGGTEPDLDTLMTTGL
ncbi:MAG: hypothetical protein M1825_000522 [Sarcosagium campestre]|nr:MAG: hypothetical protein M1825_000522 [Sarcosagium campestre]